MQKNKKEKKGVSKKAETLVAIGIGIAAGVSGAVLGYSMPADFDQDGIYSPFETVSTMAIGVTVMTFAGAAGIGIYEDHVKNKNKARVKNKADSYGHVKAV